MKYYIEKTIESDFDNAIELTQKALKEEGFGVISEIDIHKKIKEKVGVDFPEYRILGACNPSLAHKALQKENKIGTMLPCNVIVRDAGNGKIEIAAVDPVASMMAVENDELISIANDVQSRLKKVIESIG